MVLNDRILTVLRALYEHYKREAKEGGGGVEASKLGFKAKSIGKALPLIEAHGTEIQSGGQAMQEIKGVGKGIADRIDEILRTGTLAELPVVDVEKDRVVAELLTITGVGEVRAEEWYGLGVRSVADVRSRGETLPGWTHHITVGLRHHADLLERIPRSEVREIRGILEGTLAEVDAGLVFEICGSFRRGGATCGDVDVLVSHPGFVTGIEKQKFLSKLVKRLGEKGFLLDHLTEKGEKKYMGVCRGAKARRIDIRMMDYNAYYAGVLYFTGSKNFNVEVRKKALKKGYSLNEYGLTDASKNKVFLRSEEELFQILEIPYRGPTERNI